MPEGPEVKIASDYFNEFFSSSKKIEFEINNFKLIDIITHNKKASI